MNRTWSERRLGDVLEIKHGFAFLGEYFSDEGTHVVLTPGNFFDEGGFKSKVHEKWYCGPINGDYILSAGDLLIAMTEQAEGLLGSSAIVPRSGLYLHNQRLGLVKILNPAETDKRFLYYLFNSREVRSQIRASASGTKVRHTSPSRIYDVVARIPRPGVQRRIADVLCAYDDLISNCRRRIEILEEMAYSLYREWFIEFRFPGFEGHDFLTSPIGRVPQGWQIRPLASVMGGHIGGGWGSDIPSATHPDAAWVIRGTDIPECRSGNTDRVPHRFHKASNLRSRELKPGDIVFEVSGGSKGQPLGRTLFVTPELLALFGGSVMCASFCKRIRPNVRDYGAELLYLSLVHAYGSGEIEQYQVQSTGLSNFKWADYIAKTNRVVPPKDLRDQFHHYAGPLLREIATLGAQIQKLRDARDLLLPRLLSGQIDLDAA